MKTTQHSTVFLLAAVSGLAASQAVPVYGGAAPAPVAPAYSSPAVVPAPERPSVVAPAYPTLTAAPVPISDLPIYNPSSSLAPFPRVPPSDNATVPITAPVAPTAPADKPVPAPNSPSAAVCHEAITVTVTVTASPSGGASPPAYNAPVALPTDKPGSNTPGQSPPLVPSPDQPSSNVPKYPVGGCDGSSGSCPGNANPIGSGNGTAPLPTNVVPGNSSALPQYTGAANNHAAPISLAFAGFVLAIFA